MATPWRLILDGPVDGALNMALDRAAQLAHDEGGAPPTLRLYSWARPTVTLGRFQPVEAVDVSACHSLGLDVVRRFTGGRGVIHDDELTYSVIASVADGVPRGVAASYRHLCAALARAYEILGVDAGLTEHDDPQSATGSCYLATTRADLSLGARKLSGSAQVWVGSTVMQHGSFTRTRDVQREARVFGLTPGQTAQLTSGAVTLSDVLAVPPDDDEIACAVCTAFTEQLGVEMRRGSWSALEGQMAARLLGDVDVDLRSLSPST